MNNKILKALALVASLSFAAAPVSATLITDTVTVGDYEWAQVDLFAGIMWNEVNTVCPSGVCGVGTLNNYEIDGWLWANAAHVKSNVLDPLYTYDDTNLQNTGWFDGPGIEPLVDAGFRSIAWGQQNTVRGVTANTVIKVINSNDVTFGGAVGILERYTMDPNNTIIGYDGIQNRAISHGEVGVWLYRTVDVPEPSTLAIFALGMIGLASRRFKKQS